MLIPIIAQNSNRIERKCSDVIQFIFFVFRFFFPFSVSDCVFCEPQQMGMEERGREKCMRNFRTLCLDDVEVEPFRRRSHRIQLLQIVA